MRERVCETESEKSRHRETSKHRETDGQRETARVPAPGIDITSVLPTHHCGGYDIQREITSERVK